ncbi:MAG: gliding motility-associated C-terminal domain-containing protein [Bacteroidales bacterium]|nr:gliding motility-associated C-terminal domain-containing protein [Bacteroidales bacterium]
MKKRLYILVFALAFFCYQVNAQINAYFAADTLIGCGTLVVNLTDTSSGTGINYWEWDFDNDGTIDSYAQNPTTPAYGPGIYSVKLSVSNGVDTDIIVKTDYIVVRELPTASFSFDNSDYYNNSYAVLFTDLSTYVSSYEYVTTWNFADGTELATDSTQILHIFPSEGTYNVGLTITDEIGCTDTAFLQVSVEDKLEIPNVFTPNGDGINDVFTVITNGATVYEFVVYSRFGMILYKSVGTQIMWDGRTSAGSKLNTGTYFFTIKSISPDENFFRQDFVFLSKI